jgi:hypothetical protein
MSRDWATAGALAFLVITLGLWGAAPAARAPAPALGAFSVPLEFDVRAPDGKLYHFKSPAITFTPSGSESVRALSGKGTFLPAGGGTTGSTGTTGATTGTTTASTTGTTTATTGATTGTTGTTGTPTPPPANVLNVKQHGVKGDGATNDLAAINALVSQSPDGTTLYFPASTYLIGDAIKVFRSNIGFLGDGDASIIKSTAGSYHVQIGSGQPFGGISFRLLQFYGTPGQYMQGGSPRGGFLNFGSKGTVIDRCLLVGCSEPCDNAGVPNSTYGTVFTNNRVRGWGRMAMFCNGGERVSGCQFIQDDPDLFGERSSHAFYIHGGVKDVEIADTEIANVRKYAVQIYSESIPSTTDNVRLLRLNIHDCANGVIMAHGSANAGVLTSGLVEGCQITGIYAGSGIAVKNGNGVIIRNNVIDGNSGAQQGRSGSGCYLGVWAPYEVGFSLANVEVVGNTIHRCQTGIWTLPSNGGSFTNCAIVGNNVTGNVTNYNVTGPGINFIPTRPAGKAADMRPSDDRSPEAKALTAP